MPFTPFHLGPGLLFKGLAAGRFSLVAFTVTQGAMDSEVLYHMARDQRPYHGPAHSLIGSTVIGLAVAAVVAVAGQRLARAAGVSARRRQELGSELALRGAVVGGLIGGWSHVFLDSLSSTEVVPFWPLSDLRLPFGHVDARPVMAWCVIAGAVGLALGAARLLARRRIG